MLRWTHANPLEADMRGRQLVSYIRVYGPVEGAKKLRYRQQKSSASAKIEHNRRVGWWKAIQPSFLMQIALGITLPKSPPKWWTCPAGQPPAR